MTTHILILEGKTAAVIGGNSGIGRSLSLGVAAAGADGIAEIEGQREAGPEVGLPKAEFDYGAGAAKLLSSMGTFRCIWSI
jgi:NAD(P)-dependent dehydrogenase (short-subunit alcohol dehydrogenase family)